VTTDPLLPLDPDDQRIDLAQITEIAASFRESKHYLLNSIAIWTVQAELAKRDSAYYRKLAESILERSERLVDLVRDTENKLRVVSPHAVLQ
jgi:multidrug resistance efflux pump